MRLKASSLVQRRSGIARISARFAYALMRCFHLPTRLDSFCSRQWSLKTKPNDTVSVVEMPDETISPLLRLCPQPSSDSGTCATKRAQ